MDEYNSGMDPEMKRYFRKIINSFSAGLCWMISIATAGLYFRLGITSDGIRWYHIAFYLILIISLGFLIRYYFKLWNNKQE